MKVRVVRDQALTQMSQFILLHNIKSCSLAVILLCLALPVGNSVAQSPDPAGWSGEMAINQPATIESDPALTAEVRQQIGLAVSQDISTYAGSTTEANATDGITSFLSNQSEQLTSPTGIQSSIKVALLLATLSLAPAIVLMTTCYIRVIVVLSLLRQAFGGQQLPPTQVMTALSLFLTFLIMTPVWSEVKSTAIDPYTQSENGISWEEAWSRGVVPVRNFMIRQIELADNGESIELFYRYLPATAETQPTEISDVPLNVLFPAFMISELKVAFLLGFQIYLPFLVLDLVVSSVTVSMGMLMLPPNMVSFPLKLILFVLVDGWNLVVGMLLQSFQTFT